MKRLFFVILALAVLCVPALATDITISATQISAVPFNPNGLPSTRTFTVSVTNGSPTVTSSAAFPSNIVGIAGFQVLIGSTQYVVESVSSTSALTLTTNFSGITGSATLTLFSYCLFRTYPTQSFQTSDGQNIQAATPNGGLFYKQVAASIINTGSGNVLYLPEFVLPSTTDAAINNQARYVFGFYNPNGAPLATYTCGAGTSQLALSNLTNPTTWTAICTYNAPAAIVPPNTEAYSKPVIDSRFPACSSGQLYYFASNGQATSCLTLGTNLSITSGTLNASGGGGGGNINAGTTNQIGFYASNGTTISAMTVGAQLTVSGTTLKGSGLRGAINVVVDYGCAGDGVTNDTTCISNAITAAGLTASKVVYLPGGTYKVTGLTLNGDVEMMGDGVGKTIISSTTNAAILTLGRDANFRGPYVHDFTIQGSPTAGTSQNGLVVDDATYLYGARVERITSTGAGKYALYVGNAFSSSFSDLILDNSANYLLFYNASNMPSNRFTRIDFLNVRSTGPVGARIYAGEFVCDSCNGLFNVVTASKWAVVGQKAGVDGSGSNAGAVFTCNDCNFESFVANGVLAYANSLINIKGRSTFAADASGAGSAIPIQFDLAGNGVSFFAEQIARGVIEDSVSIAQALSTFANNQAINANGFAPIETMGVGPSVPSSAPLSTYYDSSAAATARLSRKDGQKPVVSVTTSTTFAEPGVRYIEANCASPCTITLPSALWYQIGQEVTIKDISGGAATNNVTVSAGGGSTVNGGSYVIDKNNQSVTFVPNNNSSDWRLAGAYGTPSPLTNTYVGYGANNILTGSANLTWDSGSKILTVTNAGSNPYIAVNDSTNSITTRFGPLSGAPNRAIIGTTSNHPFVIYSNGAAAFGADTSGNLLPYATANTTDVGSASAPWRTGYFQTSMRVGLGGSTTGGLVLLNSTNSNTVTLQAGVTSASYAVTFPTAAPGTTQCLQMSSSGVISATGSACGSSGSISGTTGTLAKFTSASAVGDSILSESSTTLTAAGRLTLNGLTINTDATGTVSALTAASTFTKNDTNSRTFDVVRVKPTFNFGGSNTSTTVNLLSVDSTNTAVTGTIFNLLNLAYGGTTKFSIDSAGAITFASGVRQAFAPSATIASLNIGQVGGDPSSPVNGDVAYNTLTNKFRCYENSAWTNCISGGTGTVNSGTQYQLGYYATSTTAISGNSGITTSAANTLLVAPSARSSGSPAVPFSAFRDAADTGLGNQEQIGHQVGGDSGQATVTKTLTGGGGAITTFRNEVHVAPTIAAAAAQTITNAYATTFDSITAGSNVTITNNYAVRVKPTVTTHNGLFVDGQVSHTGRLVDIGMAGSRVVSFAASGGTVNSVFNDNGALSSGATDGFPYISRIDSSTNPSGTPTSYNGSSAVVLQSDTSNGIYRLWGYVNSAWRDLSQSLGSTSPAQITSTQNNYNPGGTAKLQRWNTDASRQVTGLSISQQSGEEHIICNVGTQDIVLVHQSASSTAANRFLSVTALDITLTADSCATVIYDGVTQRWRLWQN